MRCASEVNWPSLWDGPRPSVHLGATGYVELSCPVLELGLCKRRQVFVLTLPLAADRFPRERFSGFSFSPPFGASTDALRASRTADSIRALSSLDHLAATEAGTVLTGHGDVWAQRVKEAIRVAKATGPT